VRFLAIVILVPSDGGLGQRYRFQSLLVIRLVKTISLSKPSLGSEFAQGRFFRL
jgi:hypothetical protein